jgi:hypothetical protein
MAVSYARRTDALTNKLIEKKKKNVRAHPFCEQTAELVNVSAGGTENN